MATASYLSLSSISARALSSLSAGASTTKMVELARTPLGLGLSVDSQYKVVAIEHGSQAERSGSFAVHDQLVALNGQPLGGGVSFEEQLGAIAVGTKITIEILTSATALQAANAEVAEPPTGTEPKAAPENIAAVLASCGLEHHAKRFEDEGYTLEKALNALASGENTLLSDLRDLKLPLGHCRKLITHLR